MPDFPVSISTNQPCFSCSSDDEENFVDEGAEDFKPSEPQSKAEARGYSNSNLCIDNVQNDFNLMIERMVLL